MFFLDGFDGRRMFGCQASVVEDSDAMMRWAKNFKATQGFKETPRVDEQWLLGGPGLGQCWPMLDIYGLIWR